MKQKNAWLSLVFFIVLCLAVEVFASFWTNQSVLTWYPQLNKPSWTPPAWVFGPVWTVLYFMIAIAGWLIYKAERTPQRSMALFFYAMQLALNFLWSFLFFSMQSPILGLIDMVLLLACILLTIRYAWPVRKLAAILLFPYLIWVMYALTLNAGIWFLND